jgi:BMFP domain-containing protein YqiC
MYQKAKSYREDPMDNKFYNLMLAGYKERLDNSTLGEIELKARLILEQEKNAELQAKVEELEALLEEQTKPAEEGE